MITENRYSRWWRITSIPRIAMISLGVRISELISTRLRSECGQGLTEYALVMALIAIVAIGAVSVLGGNVTSQISAIATSVTGTTQTTETAETTTTQKCTKAQQKKGKC